MRRHGKRRDILQIANAMLPAPAAEAIDRVRVRSPRVRIADVRREELEIATPRLLAAVKNEGGESCVAGKSNELTSRDWRRGIFDGLGMGKGRIPSIP